MIVYHGVVQLCNGQHGTDVLQYMYLAAGFAYQQYMPLCWADLPAVMSFQMISTGGVDQSTWLIAHVHAPAWGCSNCCTCVAEFAERMLAGAVARRLVPWPRL